MKRREVARFVGPNPGGRSKTPDFWNRESCLPRVFQKSNGETLPPESRLLPLQTTGTLKKPVAFGKT